MGIAAVNSVWDIAAARQYQHMYKGEGQQQQGGAYPPFPTQGISSDGHFAQIRGQHSAYQAPHPGNKRITVPDSNGVTQQMGAMQMTGSHCEPPKFSAGYLICCIMLRHRLPSIQAEHALDRMHQAQLLTTSMAASHDLTSRVLAHQHSAGCVPSSCCRSKVGSVDRYAQRSPSQALVAPPGLPATAGTAASLLPQATGGRQPASLGLPVCLQLLQPAALLAIPIPAVLVSDAATPPTPHFWPLSPGRWATATPVCGTFSEPALTSGCPSRTGSPGFP